MQIPSDLDDSPAVNVSEDRAADETANLAKQFLEDQGVAPEVREALMQKLRDGRPWDSLSQHERPISVRTEDSDRFRTVTSIYNDGSVAVSRVEHPSVSNSGLGVRPQSEAHDCSTSGDMRNDCQVDTWVGLVSMSFRMSYNAATDQVTAVYGGQWTVGGACDAKVAYIGSPASNKARMDLNAQMCQVPYNTTFFLEATISGGVATESWG